jgi:8-oxo-dGTP pyrophosphatase MutT (NUDIX family)
MNTKIFFKNKYMLLTPDEIQPQENQAFKILDAAISEINIKKILSMLLDEGNSEFLIIQNIDVKKFIDKLKKHLYYIEAAGGFIEKNGEYLFIYRLGRWDLPKGKLEDNERIEECAIRECEEECGIKELEIKKQLSSSFHIYPYKKGYALKQTYWFYMHSTYEGKLFAQTEENIDEVRWYNRAAIDKIVLQNTYFTIKEVIRQGLSVLGHAE